MKRIFSIFAVLALGLVAFAGEIKNSFKPSGIAMTLKFTEDLRFGADEDGDEFLWALDTTGIAVDQRGHIFVADTKESRVLEFDAAGEFQRIVVPKGQGPGEAGRLQSFQFINNGAVAFEGGPGAFPKFHFFDKELKFVEQKAPQGFGTIPASAYFEPTGKMFAGVYLTFDIEDGKMVTKTGVMNMEFQSVKEFSSVEQKTNFQQFADPNVLSQFIIDMLEGAFKGIGVLTFDDRGHLYSAISHKYEITKWKPDLSEPLMTITREYKPIRNDKDHLDAVIDRVLEAFRQAPGLDQAINDAFVERVKAKANLPDFKNPIAGLIAMDNGHLLVVHDTDAATGDQVVDIFSAEGQFLGQAEMDQSAFVAPSGANRMLFTNGFAYTVETDENDENRVVRYRYELVSK